MKICVISDTHMKFPVLPSADLLIYAGDMCTYGNSKQIRRNIQWLQQEKHKFQYDILVVPGNHDRCLDPDFTFQATEKGKTQHDFWKHEKSTSSTCRQMFQDAEIRLLIDEEIKIEGYKFYGTPFVLPSGQWAFGRDEEALEAIYSLIPQDTDVLITHGGSYGTLDFGSSGRHFGSISLQSRIAELNLKAHVFGHIHYCPGIKETSYMAINATYQNEYERDKGNPIHLIEI